MESLQAAPFQTITGTLTPDRVPHDGTIRRCEHGHYIGANDERAHYCPMCNPGLNIPGTRDVVLPRNSSVLDSNHRLYANNVLERHCPKCGSGTYLRVNEKGSDTNRECADCGARYRMRKTFSARVKEAEDECLE